MEKEEEKKVEKITTQERILWHWWCGGNGLGGKEGPVTFTPLSEEDEEDAQRDMNAFMDYFASTEIEELQKTLKLLTQSHYKKKNVKESKIISCYPRLYFKPIEQPYEENYKKLVAQYKLSQFIVSNLKLKKDFKFHAFPGESSRNERKGKPLYLVFIKLNDFYIVNLLGPKL